uniref:Uncharacterized protein n=1 Tax=Tanacetum cinerariifolium TaxID=118510 RepID=A0A6L2M153_TANCI|nr:hypothetical protein [Tanacetum cinerariifolium]
MHPDYLFATIFLGCDSAVYKKNKTVESNVLNSNAKLVESGTSPTSDKSEIAYVIVIEGTNAVMNDKVFDVTLNVDNCGARSVPSLFQDLCRHNMVKNKVTSDCNVASVMVDKSVKLETNIESDYQNMYVEV